MKRRLALFSMRLFAALAVLLAAPGPSPRDLEVAVPPGSPTAWARWLPALTPARGPLFPTTPARVPKGGTVVAAPKLPLDPRLGGAGVLRITTADVVGHLTWVNGPKEPTGPLTGAGGRAIPAISGASQWLGIAAFLRLMLHRQQVSEAEIIAHLVEIGEPSLWAATAAGGEAGIEGAARQVRLRVEKRRGGSAVPVGATPRETMLLRFCGEELGAAHPFDPEAAFGRRLFVLAAEMEPLLIRWLLTDAEPFLVRNATAALARYRTPTAQAALVMAAATTTDDVVLMRALAALEPGCDAGPILKRLSANTDAVETAALIAALGRIGASVALPEIVGRARRALREDPDLLMTALVALCRIPVPLDDKQVTDFAATVRRAARGNRDRFEVAHGAREAPDFPDPGSLRAETLEQLAACLRVRLGTVATATGELHELLGESRSVRAGAAYENRPISVFWPAAQIPVVETLPRMADDGQRVLRALVEDDRSDPVLRVAALAQLPPSVRGPMAETLLTAVAAAPIELRLAAVQVLDFDGAAGLVERGKRLLGLDAPRPAGASAQDRQLLMSVVQALDRRSAWQAADLLPWLPMLRAVAAAPDPARHRAWLLAAGEALVASVADGLKGKELATRVAELVDRVIAERVDPRFSAASRKATIEYVEGLLAAVRKARGNAAYHQVVARAIADYFVPDPGVSVLSSMHEFTAFVPLEEAILTALGRTREPEAVAALRELLADKTLPVRAHVCLAAAMTGDLSLLQPLARLLLDDDGFVRLCAHEALRQLTRRDVQCDWLYGTVAERGAAAQEWFKILAKVRR
ncbi:MAG: HEAT repeat domain-containing protein [Planctomycetes bacterium]|nr:HEAT repeat domain-containing protein [Planctomycetota bacterium]